MIVVDASSWVVGLVDVGPIGDAARAILSAEPDWAAPAHTPLEVLRTLRGYESSGTLSTEAADRFATGVMEAEVRYFGPDPGLLAYTWQHRHNLSPDDAPYVGLAARHGVTLVTNDGRLARAAQALGVTAVVPESSRS